MLKGTWGSSLHCGGIKRSKGLSQVILKEEVVEIESVTTPFPRKFQLTFADMASSPKVPLFAHLVDAMSLTKPFSKMTP